MCRWPILIGQRGTRCKEMMACNHLATCEVIIDIQKWCAHPPSWLMWLHYITVWLRLLIRPTKRRRMGNLRLMPPCRLWAAQHEPVLVSTELVHYLPPPHKNEGTGRGSKQLHGMASAQGESRSSLHFPDLSNLQAQPSSSCLPLSPVLLLKSFMPSCPSPLAQLFTCPLSPGHSLSCSPHLTKPSLSRPVSRVSLLTTLTHSCKLRPHARTTA